MWRSLGRSELAGSSGSVDVHGSESQERNPVGDKDLGFPQHIDGN